MRRALQLLLLAAVGCSDAADPDLREWTPDDHGRPEPGTIDRSRVPQRDEPEAGGPERAAAALFQVSCASCHGLQGLGDGGGRPPGVELPDMTDPGWQDSVSDEQLVEVIRDGRGQMPAFGERVRPQGIEALVHHIRRMRRPAPNDDP